MYIGLPGSGAILQLATVECSRMFRHKLSWGWNFLNGLGGVCVCHSAIAGRRLRMMSERVASPRLRSKGILISEVSNFLG
jgi:hypothetical protein